MGVRDMVTFPTAVVPPITPTLWQWLGGCYRGGGGAIG